MFVSVFVGGVVQPLNPKPRPAVHALQGLVIAHLGRVTLALATHNHGIERRRGKRRVVGLDRAAVCRATGTENGDTTTTTHTTSEYNTGN